MTDSHWQRLSTRYAKTILPILFLYLLYRWMDASEDPQYSASDYPEITKSLVIAATTSSNVSWVSSAIKSTNWKPYIYITDSADAQLTVPINRGNEAMVYLTYIIQNYVDSLPDIMFFHHHHENAWHQLLTASHEITYLKDQFVMDSGYVSPRCLGSCENVIELSGNYIPLSDLEDAIPRETQIGSFLMEFLGWIPEKIASPCCAQFAVSREAVYRRSLDEWKSIRKWLEETKLSSSSSGRVLEHTWHILFGMESIHCPVQNVCLCGGFGMDCT